MRANSAVLAALFFLSAALSACSRAPNLPADNAATYQTLTGSDGQEFLRTISSHDWEEGGEAAAALFSWIERDAHSADDAAAERAGEAAHAIATFLIENEEHLLRLPAGSFGLQRRPVGELNPELVRGYAMALTPFQRALVGDTGGVRGFTTIEDGGDFSSARKVFAVIDTNTQAGNDFNDAAYQRARDYLQTYAEAVASGRSDGLVELRSAAELAGVIAGGQRESGNPAIRTPTAQNGINWAGFEVAAALGTRPGGSDIEDRFFTPEGDLKSPEQVSANDLETYSTALQNFAFHHGLPGLGSDFRNWYDAGAGR